jgi:hypothetical protein
MIRGSSRLPVVTAALLEYLHRTSALLWLMTDQIAL